MYYKCGTHFSNASESRNLFYKITLSALCHFCEKSMITYAALVLKDTFAPRAASIQSILDSVDFLENYEVILAKFSSSCCYMLSFSFFFVHILLSKNYTLIYKTSSVILCTDPDRFDNIWELYHIESCRKPSVKKI